MDDEQKQIAIAKAIREDRIITFDYVSKDISISFKRTLHPTEITDKYVWGMDLDKKVLRQFLINGIQKLVIGIPYPKWQEIHHEKN